MSELVENCRIADLTLTISERLPATWATHMPFQAKPWNWFENVPDHVAPLHSGCGPYYTRWLLLDEHIGTHFDAPSHFVPPLGTSVPGVDAHTSVTADQVPLRQLWGEAVVVDVNWRDFDQSPGRSAVVDLDLLSRWEAVNRPIREGDVVLFRTHWDDHYSVDTASQYSHDVIVTKTHFGWPAPTPEVIAHLIECGVTCVGTDAPSLGSSENGQDVHVQGLSNGLVFIEGLAQLGELPATGAYFMFCPIKVEGGSGAPGRAFGLIPGDTTSC